MLPEIQSSDWKTAERAVVKYGKARRAFRKAQHVLGHCGLLAGNDNKVGVAGEFWTKKFYHQDGWRITSIEPSNNEGFDFRCAKGTRRLRVSVKVISDESKKGRQVRLKAAATWDEIFVLLLDDDLLPYRNGRATRMQFETAKTAGKIGNRPTVSRSWLGEKGWITQYGETQDW
jgi:hypothetical protein